MRPRDPRKIEAICSETIRILAKEGLAGFSMHKLAKAADISPATLYLYFKDKDDLIQSVAIARFEAAVSAMLKDFHANLSFAEGLKIQWFNRARFFMDHPDDFRLQESMKYLGFELNFQSELKKEFLQIMKSFVQRARDAGELVDIAMEEYWALAFSPLYQLIKFHIIGSSMQNRTFQLTDDIIERAADKVIYSLTPHEKRCEPISHSIFTRLIYQ